ncbi:MAG: leucine-rich repeat domain-containing protein [Candidatus Gastranaerophilaceae bacterium]
MKRSKKLISIILALAMVLTLIPFGSMTLFAEDETTGTCGSSVTWTLNSEGTLTISGTGAMYNYYSDNRSPFYNNSNIRTVIIENGVTSIGGRAFESCSSLTSVTIPDSVTSIGKNAFFSCSGLTNISIPNSVTSIDNYAFYNCSALASVTIPDGVTKIGTYVFYYCTSLTSVTISNSVTSIGASAFSYCKGLTNITIPNSVTSIGASAFSFCIGLTNITIPDSVTDIGDSAFNNCINLKSVTMPDDLTEIGAYVFYNCKSLTSVTIPDSVTSIGKNAFYSCTGLTNISIPNGVTSIGNYAFYNCTSLTRITISNSVTSIGTTAFDNCTSLTKVRFRGTEEEWNNVSWKEQFDGKTIIFNCNGNHTGGTATCTEKARCDYCDEEYGDYADHTYATTLSYDDDKHWYAATCAHTTERKGEENHSFTNYISNNDATCITDGTKTATCDGGCGKTDTVTDVGSKDNVDHSFTVEVSSTTANCVEKGSVTYKCSTCTETYTAYGELDPTNHKTVVVDDGIPATCTEKGKTEGSHCTACNKVIVVQMDIDSLGGHTGGVANCVDKKVCSRCNTAYGELDPTNHKTVVVDDGIPATCTEKGKTEGSHCTACNKVIVAQMDIDSLGGHTGGVANCVDKKICSRCNTPYGEIDSTNHKTVVVDDGIPATCTEKGKTEGSHCTACNKVIVAQMDIDSLGGHTGGTATCSAKAVCDNCGEEYGDYADHTYATTLSYDDDKHWYAATCAHTTERKGEENHSFTNYISNNDATCITDGTKTATCDGGCGKTDTVTDVGSKDNVDHSFTVEVSSTTANCVEKGSVTYKCSTCTETYTAYGELDPTNHKTVVVDDGIPATCTEKGKTEGSHCTACNKVIVAQKDTNPLGHTGGTATCVSKAICKNCDEEYGEIDSDNHNIEKASAKEPSSAEFGNIEYWYCPDCGICFDDENCEKVIKYTDTLIAKLPPEIIDGEGQSLTQGENKELSFRSNAAMSDFIRVELDGVTVASQNYTVTQGSTIVALKSEYVATLSPGEHTIGIVSQSGTATEKFTVNAKAVDNSQTQNNTTDSSKKDESLISPKTGSDSAVVIWLAFILSCGSAITVIGVARKRKNEFN